MKPEEEELIRHYLKPEYKVLEWGSGVSTLELAKEVDLLVSIEYDRHWYKKIGQKLSDVSPNRFHYILSEPTTPWHWDPDQDGNLRQFIHYVVAPLSLGIVFDLIIIDGRARAYCAEVCPIISHKETQIFLHDYRPNEKGRESYGRIPSVLRFEEQIKFIARFTIF